MNQDKAVQALLDKIEPGRLYEIKEAAAILDLSQKVVYTLVAEGGIKAFRMRGRWKIHSVSLCEYIKKSWMAEPKEKL